MKYTFLLLPFLFACTHTPSHKLFVDTPKYLDARALKFINVDKESHKKYVVKGRCGDGDGPKEQHTLLDVTNPEVTASELWLDTKHKNILERIVFNYKNQEISMNLSQAGCSHFGWNFTFFVDQNFPYTDTNKAISEAISLIQFGHDQKLFKLNEDDLKSLEDFKKNILVKVSVYSPQKGSKIKSKHICEKSEFQILCSSYKDPNNYEIIITPTTDKRYTVSFNHWFVM